MSGAKDHPEKVGPYAIDGELGRGGMGVVYLAHDDRLGRKVALKVLPEAFPNEEMSLRFEREARTAAQLNHPNIATIHEIGADGDTTYIAMERVEGRTLHDLIDRRPMRTRDLLRIAHGIADGLAAAHARGIVHRDIKPSNVIVDDDGRAKILDFGLAKPIGPAVQMSGVDDERATVTLGEISRKMTMAGQVLGTVAYMSPEQAKGHEVDHRTDIFSLGVVMYEMATGAPPFAGDTSVTTIAKILETNPRPLAEVNPTLPAEAQRIINRCLEKNPRDRYQSAADLAHDLAEAERTVAETTTRTVAIGRAGGGAPVWGYTIAGVAVGALAAAAFMWFVPHDAATEQPQEIRFSISARHMAAAIGADVESAIFRNFELSPDGKSIALRLAGADQPVYIRSWESDAYRRLPGTEGGARIGFSPDGAWVLYEQDDALRRAPVAGGPALTILEADEHPNPGDSNAMWLEDDTIVIAGGPEGMFRVSVTGGEVTKFADTDPERSLFGFINPERIPGRSDVVLASMWTGPGIEQQNIVTVSLEDGAIDVILEPGGFPQLTSDGRLAFMRDSTILTAPFDAQTLSLRGEPTVLLPSVAADSWGGAAWFVLADTGVYCFVDGARVVADRRILRFDESGAMTGVDLPRDDYAFNLSPSPVDNRIAVSTLSRTLEMWVIDIDSGLRTRIASGFEAYAPVWSPDGTRVAYSAELNEDNSPEYNDPSIRIVDLTRDSEPVTLDLPRAWYTPLDFSPDGSLLLLGRSRMGAGRKIDLMYWSFEEERLIPYLETENNHFDGRFSPDGEWVVYKSDESGSSQIYVRAFPNDGRRWQVSRAGNVVGDPFWSHDGATIHWVNGRTLFGAAFSSENGVVVGPPAEKFSHPLLRFASDKDLSLAHDGTFMMLEPAAHYLTDSHVNIVLNPSFRD